MRLRKRKGKKKEMGRGQVNECSKGKKQENAYESNNWSLCGFSFLFRTLLE